MRKKGFTLMELLVVIAVLAIIALIAVPIVNNIVYNSRKSTFTRTVGNMMEAVDWYLLDEYDGKFANKKVFNLNSLGIIEQKDQNSDSLKYDGSIDGIGTIVVNPANEYYVHYSTNLFCANKSFSDKSVTVTSGSCPASDLIIILDPDQNAYVVQKGIEFEIPTAVAFSATGDSADEITTTINRINTDGTTDPNVSVIDTDLAVGTQYQIIYTASYNGDSISKIVNLTVVDATEPYISSLVVNANSSEVTGYVSALDNESGIKDIEFILYDGNDKKVSSYKYDINELQVNNYSHKFENLQANTNYKLSVKVNNGSEVVSEQSKEFMTEYINRPVIVLGPEEYSQKKQIMITYPENQNGMTYNYSIGTNNYNTLNNETSTTVEISENNIIVASISDGVNEISSATYDIVSIDKTIPDYATLIIKSSTKSIVVLEAAATDSQSGIYGYKFSKDGGQTWTSLQTSPTYTFTNITEGNYSFIAKAYNNTYGKYGFEEQYGTRLTNTVNYESTRCSQPTFTINPTGANWAQAKVVTINYGNKDWCTGSYSVDGGATWTENSSVVVYDNDTVIIAKNDDGEGDVAASVQLIDNIDRVKPTLTVNTSSGSYSIDVTATVSTNVSGIYSYEYNINGGSWVEKSVNTHTFTGLSTGTYSIGVRVTNNAYHNTATAYKDSSIGVTEEYKYSVSVVNPTTTTTRYQTSSSCGSCSCSSGSSSGTKSCTYYYSDGSTSRGSRSCTCPTAAPTTTTTTTTTKAPTTTTTKAPTTTTTTKHKTGESCTTSCDCSAGVTMKTCIIVYSDGTRTFENVSCSCPTTTKKTTTKKATTTRAATTTATPTPQCITYSVSECQQRQANAQQSRYDSCMAQWVNSSDYDSHVEPCLNAANAYANQVYQACRYC